MKIGIDIGGTFTDFVVQDEPAGEIRSFKLPSTPNAPEQAVLLGLERLRLGPDTLIVHGSTVATNAILERKGARRVHYQRGISRSAYDWATEST